MSPVRTGILREPRNGDFAAGAEMNVATFYEPSAQYAVALLNSNATLS